MKEQTILVIKHGSLGDWILATGAFKLIRQHYPAAKIIFLTQSFYAPLAKACGWFDEVWTDERLPLRNIISNLKVIRKLRSHSYDHVFDLQCSSRTSLYHTLIKSKVANWYGRAKGCSHYVPFNPNLHAVELARDIIQASGITILPAPDTNFLKSSALRSKIKSFGRFVLFTPGCSAKHLVKRWTPEGYAKVIEWLASKGIKSVLVGTGIDKQIIEAIAAQCSTKPISLVNQTTFADLAELARSAQAILGSDTGPMHLAAATRTPSLVLFSKVSNPKKSRPWGQQVQVIKEEDLNNLSSNVVISELAKLLTKQPSSVKSPV